MTIADLKVLLHDRVQLEQVAVHTGHATFVLLSIHCHLHHTLGKATRGQRLTQLACLRAFAHKVVR